MVTGSLRLPGPGLLTCCQMSTLNPGSLGCIREAARGPHRPNLWPALHCSRPEASLFLMTSLSLVREGHVHHVWGLGQPGRRTRHAGPGGGGAGVGRGEAREGPALAPAVRTSEGTGLARGAEEEPLARCRSGRAVGWVTHRQSWVAGARGRARSLSGLLPELLSNAVSCPRDPEAGVGVLGRRFSLGRGSPFSVQEARQDTDLFKQEDASRSLGTSREPPSPGVAAKHEVRSPGECWGSGEAKHPEQQQPPCAWR